MAEIKDSHQKGRLSRHTPTEISNLPTPSSDLCFEEVFDFPFIRDAATVDYLNNHGRVMFIIRGPSGTRKHTLASMIIAKYPTIELCCADNYFSEPFAPGTKTRENLKKSHLYCEEKALRACQEGKHPIMIKNTCVRKWEMQYYLNLAIEYCYTTVMVITLRKLKVTPKVLEKTNTQGLKKPYFNKRLNQWEEVVPQYTGWMLSPVDASYLMREYEKCLESLSELDDFSRVFCTQDKGSAKEFFTPEYFPFCIAAYCQNGKNPAMKSYYLSPHTLPVFWKKYPSISIAIQGVVTTTQQQKVQAMYGRVFPLNIQAFVITKSLTAAVVHLSEDMKNLVRENEECTPSDSSDVIGGLSALSVYDNIKPQKPLNDYMTNYLQTFTLCQRFGNEKIETENCSFIVLSTAVSSSSEYPYIENVSKFSEILFSTAKDCNGDVTTTSFNTLDNDSKYCSLSCGSWLILPPKNITVQSVFTGLYV